MHSSHSQDCTQCSSDTHTKLAPWQQLLWHCSFRLCSHSLLSHVVTELHKHTFLNMLYKKLEVKERSCCHGEHCFGHTAGTEQSKEMQSCK